MWWFLPDTTMLNIIHIFGPNFLILTEFQERPGWKEEEEGKEASEKQENQERQLRQNRKKSQEKQGSWNRQGEVKRWLIFEPYPRWGVMSSPASQFLRCFPVIYWSGCRWWGLIGNWLIADGQRQRVADGLDTVALDTEMPLHLMRMEGFEKREYF